MGKIGIFWPGWGGFPRVPAGDQFVKKSDRRFCFGYNSAIGDGVVT